VIDKGGTSQVVLQYRIDVEVFGEYAQMVAMQNCDRIAEPRFLITVDDVCDMCGYSELWKRQATDG